MLTETASLGLFIRYTATLNRIKCLHNPPQKSNSARSSSSPAKSRALIHVREKEKKVSSAPLPNLRWNLLSLYMVDYACWQALKCSLGVSRVLSFPVPTRTRTYIQPNYDLP